jgi:hypothetical protein
MTEEDARLALLQTELNAIQSAIRNFDTTMFQIKGWCVTAALAIGGFAVAYRKPALLVVGIGAVISFYLVDCQFKMIQRMFIKRNRMLDSELKTVGIMEVLRGGGNIDIVGTVSLQWPHSQGSFIQRLIRYLSDIRPEARAPSTFGLYLFILICLITEMVILG